MGNLNQQIGLKRNVFDIQKIAIGFLKVFGNAEQYCAAIIQLF